VSENSPDGRAHCVQDAERPVDGGGHHQNQRWCATTVIH
jgi:hypothetical protein